MCHTGLTTWRVLASAVKKIDSVSELLIHAGGVGGKDSDKWQITQRCVKKKRKRKSVTSEFVRFEGVKLFALFAVIKFRRRSKTAINYGCKGLRFQRAAAADMSFFGVVGGGAHYSKIQLRLFELQKKASEKQTDGAIVLLQPCWYLTSLCVGCSASSLPEGCFPNHINEGAMLGPAMPRRCLYSRAALFTLYLY